MTVSDWAGLGGLEASDVVDGGFTIGCPRNEDVGFFIHWVLLASLTVTGYWECLTMITDGVFGKLFRSGMGW